jgi:lipoyl(octanoyl) transferase
MRMSLFTALDVYRDDTGHPAAVNMAIDEALLEQAAAPSIRFYRWQSPALSFGYFGKFVEVASYAHERDLVRRWTGGGTVFHGEDLTYSIVIRSDDPVFGESSMSIYERIHRALVDALAAIGQPAVVAAIDGRGSARSATETGISDPGYNGARGCSDCFAKPVRADVVLNGRKIAGAAQRRTRAGLLHQGSIQNVDLGTGLADQFAQVLSSSCNMRNLSAAVHDQAQQIAAQKYGTDGWLRKR